MTTLDKSLSKDKNVDKDYLRCDITIHESNFREENQYWSFANGLMHAKNGFMHAKNGLGMVKPHVMGACILTFESINKDNPLTTNQTIAAIANDLETFMLHFKLFPKYGHKCPAFSNAILMNSMNF